MMITSHSRAAVACACLVALSAAPPVVHAQQSSFCQAVLMILANSPNKFLAIRQPFDFKTEKYPGSVVIPGLEKCDVKSGSGNATYSCSRMMEDDATRARAAYDDTQRTVAACLGDRLRSTRQSQAELIAVWFKTKPNDDEITVTLHRADIESSTRPPYYRLSVRVRMRDVTSKED